MMVQFSSVRLRFLFRFGFGWCRHSSVVVVAFAADVDRWLMMMMMMGDFGRVKWARWRRWQWILSICLWNLVFHQIHYSSFPFQCLLSLRRCLPLNIHSNSNSIKHFHRRSSRPSPSSPFYLPSQPADLMRARIECTRTVSVCSSFRSSHSQHFAFSWSCLLRFVAMFYCSHVFTLYYYFFSSFLFFSYSSCLHVQQITTI